MDIPIRTGRQDSSDQIDKSPDMIATMPLVAAPVAVPVLYNCCQDVGPVLLGVLPVSLTVGEGIGTPVEVTCPQSAARLTGSHPVRASVPAVHPGRP